jgi:hypothetical protein
MKKVFNIWSFTMLVGMASVTLFNCSKSGKHEDEQIEWKEMDDFHMVMADVYHPLKDSGNLEPIKSRAAELAASASTWADSKLPEKVDNEETKGLLLKLKEGAQALEDQINSGATDNEIQTQLTSLHDLFHSIQEKWYGGGGDEGHHH